jgi:amino acid adenylation domain-containing protein
MSDTGQRISNLSIEERAAMERRLLDRLAGAAPKQRITPRASLELSPCPLSFAQQRLWFLSQLSPESAVYNIPRAMRIKGALDVAVLSRALDAIVARHEALRTTFRSEGGEPAQVIGLEASVEIRQIDLTQLPEAEKEAELERVFRAEMRRPVNLAADLMLRAAVARLGPTDHGLLLVMHHIAADGWSMGLFVKELITLYEAYRSGAPSPLAPLPIQYADFAIWQRKALSGPELAKQLAYWKKQLAAAPAALEMPTDRPRPAVMGGSGARQVRLMPRSLLDALKELGREEGTTLFMTLLAAFQVLLHRYTGDVDISVGSPIAGRNRVETEKLIGFFVNTLVLRTDLSQNPTFRELLRRVKEVALGAFGHQDMPFEKLVEELRPERSKSRTPLFQVMFILQNAPREAMDLSGLTLRTLEIDPGTTKFDLTLSLGESALGLKALLGYSDELFEAASIARFLEHYETLLVSVVADPKKRIGELAIMPPSERRRVVVDFNRTRTNVASTAQQVHAWVEAQVERTPDAIAVSFGASSLTYRELNQRAGRLARRLRALGVGPDVRVGVSAPRSLEMVVGLLAVLKAGGAYVPIDPAYPKERIGVMLEDAKVLVLLTFGSLVPDLPPHEAQVICLDTDEAMAASASGSSDLDAPLPVLGNGESLAYVIYTSGSTGKPKGVAMPHRPLVNLIAWQHRSWARPGPRKTLQFASVSFDVSFQEIFSTLSSGGELVLISDDVRRDPSQLLGVLVDLGVERAYLPPIVLQHLSETAELERRAPTALREIITAGEQLVISRAIRKLCEVLPGVSIHNHYGPTEAHAVTAHVLSAKPELGPVPIGKPIDNARIYLLDPHQNPVPVGVPGELYIGGVCLAHGYLGRPELTEQKFVPVPASLVAEEEGQPAARARLYRTGDRCRYRPDGAIEFLGRMDLQVKIRGYRIELGEIESVLGQHPSVLEVVVLAREDDPSNKRLVAYVVPNHEGDGLAQALRDFLKDKLPEFMVPSAFVVLSRLPVTPNGKIDRRALPAPSFGGEVFVAPRTPVEQIVAAVFSELLKAPKVSAESDFFELGGHSLLATRVISRVREVLGVDIPVRGLFEAPTVAELSVVIAQALFDRSPIEELAGLSLARLLPEDRALLERRLLSRKGARAAEPTIARRHVDGPAPLSFSQQRLWFLEEMTPGTAVYHIPMALRVLGRLDLDVLHKALEAIVARHEVLRTTFGTEAGEPVQIVHPAAPIPFGVVELAAHPDREEECRRVLREEASRPFDLKKGPMLRALVVRVSAEDHAVLVTMHHIASDGWSMSLVQHELAALYEALTEGRPSRLPPLPIQYADFAAWQRGYLTGEVLDRQLAYWKERLVGAPPFLDLPTDHPRPPELSYRGAARSIELSAELCASLKALCRDEGATLFMALLAAFQVLLSRYAGQPDVSVGSPVAGRTRIETEALVGFFINTLVFRVDLASEPSFRALLAQTREASLSAFAHQDIPFERLVEELRPERAQNRTPLFQALFILQNAPKALPEVSEITFKPMSVGTGTTKFDLTLAASEIGEELKLSLSYAVDLFEPETIVRMLENYRTLLEGAVAHPDASVAVLPIVSDAERWWLLSEWSRSHLDFPLNRCLHELFAQQAAKTPDATALSFEGRTLSYRELDRRTNQLARYLQKKGVGPEVLVGIFCERSVEMVVGMIAVLKAGGGYVPLDPSYPKARNELILEDAKAPLLLTQQHLIESLPAITAELIFVDALAALLAEESAESVRSGTQPHNIGYVLYTSGSTGTPKGVVLAHRSAVALIAWALSVFSPEELRGTLFATSICFDLSIFEVFTPLACGGTVIGAANVLALPALPERDEVTLVNTVPSAMAELLRLGSLPLSVRTVNLAGEPLSSSLVRQIYAIPTVERLYNLYGPTEDTTYSSGALMKRDPSAPVVLGKILPNSHGYVLDARMQLVPIGVHGELYLGGDGLARGYLNRPDLTRERFVPDPFSDNPSVRIYKTGDRVRLRSDGDLQFVERIDHQIKLRGFRIELAEIEAVLAQQPSVREVVVLLREDVPGDQRIVAYVRLDPSEAKVSELRSFLRDKLPEFMIPSAFVALEAFPRTASGKIDRKALPALEPAAQVEQTRLFVPPKNPIEETLAGIWMDVLRLSRVGSGDNFFDLGGHSLLATRVVTRIRDAFEIELPLKTLFASPTIAELAIAVSQQALLELRLAKAGRAPEPAASPLSEEPVKRASRAIPRRLEEGPGPLSFAQQRLWFLEEMMPGTAVYNIPMGLRALGALDLPTLTRALDAIVARHAVLRTTFTLHQGAPGQILRPDASVVPRVIDLRGLAPDEREVEAQRILREEARVPFDLSRDLMLRATIVRLGDEEHALFFVVHHIASDAWSTGVFFRELTALYGAFKIGAPSPLPELPIQYADFAAFQEQHLRGEVLEAQLAYWRGKLAGVPPLELPTDRPRPPVQTTRGAMRTLALPKALVGPLRALGREAGATEFMTFLAAFQVLLHRFTGQEDISVGTPIAGRNWIEIEPLIGFFVNTLVMRTSVAGAPTFRELLRRVRDTAFDAFAHQDLPFEKLVSELRPERVTSRTPLFQVMFAFQNAPRQALSLSGTERKPLGVSLSTGTAKFDLTAMVNEGPDGFRATFEYNTDLFDPSTIERMLSSFQVLLSGIVEDPDARVDRIPILTERERQQLLVGWNHPTAPHPPKARIHEIVAEQARRTPEAVAVVFEGERLTYAALDRRANQIAHLLRQSGVGPDVLVGVCLERSVSMIVALLGILKAGGAYVPLDPTYPADRLEFMLGDAKAPVVLTQAHLTAVLPAHSGSGGRVVRLDAERDEIDRQPETAVGPSPGEGPQNLAYIIYTSGSTGRPKGVMVTHHNVVRLFEATQRWYGFNDQDVWTMFHSYAFDFSVWEIWGALFHGGRVVVVPYLTSRSPDAFYKLLGDEGVTVLNQTPSAFRQLVHAEASEDKAAQDRLKLRYVIFGGEALELSDLRPFWARHGDKKPALINMYGITETTVHVTYRPVGLPDLERPWSSVIGQAIGDLSVFILDQHKEPVPVGVRGEMYVGGAGLAKGYLNRPELTRERFIKSPFSADPGACLYKTGDLARYLPSGDIEYLGRIDHQVKIRGHRIELGEIEAVLGQHPDAREVAVLVREDTPGDKRIVAYMVSAKGAAPSAADLRAFLEQKLPDVMIPSAFVQLEKLPLTENGKIDRQALPKPEVDLGRRGLLELPKSPVEAKLASIWEAILGVKNISSRDNFFELGGHSMLAVRMVAEVEREFGKKIPLALLFENQTLEQLSRLLQIEGVTPEPWPVLIAIQPRGTRQPLFCVSTFNVNALGYVALARNLGQDQPVYGLQSQYRKETGQPYQRHEFEARAREYIAAMKKVAPHGPYYLCGMCEGAHIAFEMARLLHEEGETIGLLGILDAWPIENTRRLYMTHIEGYRSRFEKRWRRLQKFGGPRKQAIYLAQRLRERVTSFFDRIAIDLSPSQELDLATREQRAFVLELRRRYWPGPDFVPPTVQCPIYLFRLPTQPYWRIQDPECGWGSRTTVGVEIHTIAGEHETILREPYVRMLAEKLNSCLLRNGVARSPSSVTP